MTTRTGEIGAFLIGFAVGLRSATPLAVIGRAERDGRLALPSPLCYIGARPVAPALTVAAASELVIDKMPFTPSRLELRSLVVRAGTGALSGACISEDARSGALLGAAGALAGSFAGYEARLRLSERLSRGLPPWVAKLVVALVEDLACVGLSLWIVSRKQDDRV